MLEELLKQNKIYLIAFVCLVLAVSLGVRLLQRVPLDSPSTRFTRSGFARGVEVLKNPTVPQANDKSFILVHISGAVKNRGVYKVKQGSRVIDAIEYCGGLLKNADLSSLNLSQTLKDGQKLEIPQTAAVANGTASAGRKISINSASESELDTISGVGPSTAKKIVECRSKNGAFKSIDDLKKVKGFGKSRIEKIKAEITL